MFYLRVWDGESMHYLTPEEVDDSLTFRSDRHFEGDIETVMLGVKLDSKVVYEGDFVLIYDNSKKKIIIGLIDFVLGTFVVITKGEHLTVPSMLMNNSFYSEVVGNLIENPELMEEVF